MFNTDFLHFKVRDIRNLSLLEPEGRVIAEGREWARYVDGAMGKIYSKIFMGTDQFYKKTKDDYFKPIFRFLLEQYGLTEKRIQTLEEKWKSLNSSPNWAVEKTIGNLAMRLTAQNYYDAICKNIGEDYRFELYLGTELDVKEEAKLETYPVVIASFITNSLNIQDGLGKYHWVKVGDEETLA